MGRHDQLQDFERFDFESNQAFKQWLSNVEVVNNDEETKRRLQAKWYKREIDKNFDLDWLSASKPASARSAAFSSTTNTSSSTAPNQGNNAGSAPQAPPRTNTSSSSTYASSGGTARPSSANLGPGTPAQHRHLVLYHVLLLVLAVVNLIPFFPRWSAAAYRLFMQATIVGQAYKIYLRHGAPRLRPFSLPALQHYLALVVPTSDFHWLVIGFCFFGHIPITVIMAPLVLEALQGVLTWLGVYAPNSFAWTRAGSKLYAYMQGKKGELQFASAYSEIMVGAILVMGLLGRARNFLLTFAYWNLLKLRYHISDSAAMHRQAWHSMDRRTSGIRARFPFINTAVGYVSRWFLSLR